MSFERATYDRPDVRDGRLVHVVYLVPSDFPDEGLDIDGTLDCSTRAQNQWFEEASDGLRWRFDTFLAPTGKPGANRFVEATDVTFVRSELPGDSLNSGFEVEDELRKLGFAHPEKRYLSFVASDASTKCGDAISALAPPPTIYVDGQYAQVYLFSADSCRSHEFGVPGDGSWADAIAQQELIHNDGLVSPGAPHSQSCLNGSPPGLAHVCTVGFGLGNLDPEWTDVMFPTVSVPLSEKSLDRGNDDYFRHRFPHLFDLEDSPYVEPAP